MVGDCGRRPRSQSEGASPCCRIGPAAWPLRFDPGPGLDPVLERLPAECGRAKPADAIETFCRGVIDAVRAERAARTLHPHPGIDEIAQQAVHRL